MDDNRWRCDGWDGITTLRHKYRLDPVARRLLGEVKHVWSCKNCPAFCARDLGNYWRAVK